MTARRRLIIDASNFSHNPQRMVRTGIQEVVYRTAMAAVELRQEFPDLEILVLPFLPRRVTNGILSEDLLLYKNLSPALIEQVENELKMSSKEVWGIDLRQRGYAIADQELWTLLRDADFIHFQSLLKISSIVTEIRNLNPQQLPQISATVYDLIPLILPDTCAHSVPKWFANTYLPSLFSSVDKAFCISKATAHDVLDFLPAESSMQVEALPLPFDLKTDEEVDFSVIKKQFGLEEQNYVVYLGSFEPRKNFISLLRGFEFYRELNPDSTLKLVVVGSTGWKNEVLELHATRSKFASEIIRTGYLDDAPLVSLIRRATAMAMLSLYEGFGLPLAQAYSLGVPVITSYSSSLPEACEENGIFVDPADPYAVAAAIKAAGHLQNRPTPKTKHFSWIEYTRTLIQQIQSSKSINDRDRKSRPELFAIRF